MIASVLAARGASVGALVRHGSEVRFTAPGTDPAEIDAAFGAADGGVRVHDVQATLDAVKVLGAWR